MLWQGILNYRTERNSLLQETRRHAVFMSERHLHVPLKTPLFYTGRQFEDSLLCARARKKKKENQRMSPALIMKQIF